MFRFKQFSVNQTNCAMKINTDGVLLGALAEMGSPKTILDIGTGTGVIALMLAQKYSNVLIDAVEIDENAAETAKQNFNNSTFNKQLRVYIIDINVFLKAEPANKYDLIISNPPFYINSLISHSKKKSLAKHTDLSFFEILFEDISNHLTENGCFWIILPIDVALLVKPFATKNGLNIQQVINIKSFKNIAPHREIIRFGFNLNIPIIEDFIIYDKVGIYSNYYRKILQPYFLAF